MSSAQIQPTEIRSVEEFIKCVKSDSRDWPHVWFRGEPAVEDTPLLPKLYRKKPDGSQHHENKLLQLFRSKAPMFGNLQTPRRDDVDEWLFLAQHVGLPTRLLDWTESALIALYFALLQKEPVVWALNPVELNKLTGAILGDPDEFPLTWLDPQSDQLGYLKVIIFDIAEKRGAQLTDADRTDVAKLQKCLASRNFGAENILAAWGDDQRGNQYPAAVLPTNIHRRMSVQRSCFTVQGKCKDPLSAQLKNCDSAILRLYKIKPERPHEMLADLRTLGISYSTIFPDLDGLAKELSMLY